MNKESPAKDQQTFVEELTENQHRLFAFVVALSGDWAEAEEIYQRACVVLWEKWSEYDQARSFLPWAMGVCRMETLKCMSEKGRRKEVLGGEAIAAIEARVSKSTEGIDERLATLQFCLDKLTREQRSLIDKCYGGSWKINEIATEIGLTADAIYGRLKRIRETLHHCVDRTLAAKR